MISSIPSVLPSFSYHTKHHAVQTQPLRSGTKTALVVQYAFFGVPKKWDSRSFSQVAYY